jgi:hypothetical protein
MHSDDVDKREFVMSDLFNLVIAACGDPKRGFWHKDVKSQSIKKHIAGTARTTRADLLGAQKFVVCDSLLQHAVTASCAPPQTLLNMFEIGVPPFDNMWIEWDDKKRIPMLFDIMDKLGWERGYDPAPDSWQDTIGLHITRSTSKNVHNYNVEQFCFIENPDGKGGKISMPSFSVQFCPDAPILYEPKRLLHTMGQTGEESLMRANQHIHGERLISPTYVHNHGGKRRKPMTDVFERTLLTLGNFGGAHLLEQVSATRSSSASVKDEAEKLLQKERNSSIDMWVGDLRFLIAVLALINYPHTVIERKLEKSIRRMAFGRPVPRNELRTLEIDLPKPRGTTRYERMFKGGGGKKRRHVRRGHWHTYIYKGGVRKTKWLGERWCGNAELGTITHDYELKSKKTK